jgi:hypothetical protein
MRRNHQRGSPGRGARFGVLAVVACTLVGCATSSQPLPLLAAHAHNDYEHARPLLDALEHGFCSVEADVYLRDGRLLVAHDQKDVRPERTLEALYLDPLRARVRANGGRVFRDVPTITLLVDVKSEARSTYAALEAVLALYADILTVFEPSAARPGAVTVVVSGNRTLDDVLVKDVRYSALDGRSGDLDSGVPATVYPWISENWTKLSAWRGEGDFPTTDQERLRDWVNRAHARGRKIRFWNTPETTEAWRILSEAGVDYIGTDNLARLRDFFAFHTRAKGGT